MGSLEAKMGVINTFHQSTKSTMVNCSGGIGYAATIYNITAPFHHSKFAPLTWGDEHK
jgi:hypothetical protein